MVRELIDCKGERHLYEQLLEYLTEHNYAKSTKTQLERKALETYMNYLSKFKWYPAPPDLKTSRDAANERDFWEYVKLDPRNLEFAMQIACYIANVLEDGYIEGRILADFPGVLGYNLSVMRDHQYQDMRTVTQMMEMEDAGSGHIFHTILQIMLSYALYGEIKYGETPLSDERIQTIFRLIPQLDTAVTTASAKERWKIVSLILIRCWHHIEDYIELCKKHQDEAATSGTGSSAGEVLSGLLQVIAGSSAEGTGSEKPVSGSEVRKGVAANAVARTRTQALARKNGSGDDDEKPDESETPGKKENESGDSSSEENKSEEKPASNQADSDDSSGSDDVSTPLSGTGGDSQKQETTAEEGGRIPFHQTDSVSAPVGGSTEYDSDYKREMNENAATDIERMLEQMAEKAAVSSSKPSV